LPALHPLTDATTKPSRAAVAATRDRWLMGSSPDVRSAPCGTSALQRSIERADANFQRNMKIHLVRGHANCTGRCSPHGARRLCYPPPRPRPYCPVRLAPIRGLHAVPHRAEPRVAGPRA
jgi:hypothetical protein